MRSEQTNQTFSILIIFSSHVKGESVLGLAEDTIYNNGAANFIRALNIAEFKAGREARKVR